MSHWTLAVGCSPMVSLSFLGPAQWNGSVWWCRHAGAQLKCLDTAGTMVPASEQKTGINLGPHVAVGILLLLCSPVAAHSTHQLAYCNRSQWWGQAGGVQVHSQRGYLQVGLVVLACDWTQSLIHTHKQCWELWPSVSSPLVAHSPCGHACYSGC